MTAITEHLPVVQIGHKEDVLGQTMSKYEANMKIAFDKKKLESYSNELYHFPSQFCLTQIFGFYEIGTSITGQEKLEIECGIETSVLAKRITPNNSIGYFQAYSQRSFGEGIFPKIEGLNRTQKELVKEARMEIVGIIYDLAKKPDAFYTGRNLQLTPDIMIYEDFQSLKNRTRVNLLLKENIYAKLAHSLERNDSTSMRKKGAFLPTYHREPLQIKLKSEKPPLRLWALLNYLFKVIERISSRVGQNEILAMDDLKEIKEVMRLKNVLSSETGNLGKLEQCLQKDIIRKRTLYAEKYHIDWIIDPLESVDQNANESTILSDDLERYMLAEARLEFQVIWKELLEKWDRAEISYDEYEEAYRRFYKEIYGSIV